MPLDGRRVLVTGGGGGLGRALALEAAGRGARVLACGRDGVTLDETASLGPDGRIAMLVADVTHAEGRRAIAERLRGWGGVDVLVNNAGVQSVGALAGQDDDALRAMVETNLLAPAALVRDCLPLLRASDRPRIVNVGSMFGDIGFPLFAVYSATKFGLRGLSDALRRELASEGIGVTYLAPRAIRTGASAASAHLVEPFAMTLDEPADVARRAWDGIEAGRRAVYPGLAERATVLVQQLMPGLVDRTLVKQLRRVVPRVVARAPAG